MEDLAVTQELNPIINIGFFKVLIECKTYSGEKIEALTVFPKNLSWESVCKGMRQSFIHQENIMSCDITVFYGRNNKYQPIFKEDTYYYDEPRKEYLKTLL